MGNRARAIQIQMRGNLIGMQARPLPDTLNCQSPAAIRPDQLEEVHTM